MSLAMAGMMGASLLAGCGSSGTSSAATETTEDTAAVSSSVKTLPDDDTVAVSSTSKAEAKYNMGYVLSVRDEYLSLLEEAVADQAEANDVDMDMYFAENDSSRVLQYIEQAKNEGKDAILVNVVAAEDAAACVEAAGDTPLVFINRAPADSGVLTDTAVAVVSDENESGKMQGEFLADYFNEQGQSDVSYLLLEGTEGLVHTTLRTDGAIAAMKDGGLNVTEAGIVMGDYDRTAAAEGVASLLEEGVDFDVILSNNDAMALGAIQAMKDAGVDPTSKVIVGIDGLGDAQAALESGEMKMTVYQDAVGQADASIKAAINMVEGKDAADGIEYPTADGDAHTIYVPFVEITK